MKTKPGQESAFPIGSGTSLELGMSKRFYAACAAMQGILTSAKEETLLYTFEQAIPQLALMYADELLKQENE